MGSIVNKYKLIKISEEHYIVVVVSAQVKDIGVYVYDDDYQSPLIYQTCEEFFRVGKQGYKITHSFGKELDGVENRPLSESQEIEYGYNIEEMAINSFGYKPNKGYFDNGDYNEHTGDES